MGIFSLFLKIYPFYSIDPKLIHPEAISLSSSPLLQKPQNNAGSTRKTDIPATIANPITVAQESRKESTTNNQHPATKRKRSESTAIFQPQASTSGLRNPPQESNLGRNDSIGNQIQHQQMVNYRKPLFDQSKGKFSLQIPSYAWVRIFSLFQKIYPFHSRSKAYLSRSKKFIS